MSFDTLYSLENRKRHEQFAEVRKETEALLPGYTVKMTMDLNIS